MRIGRRFLPDFAWLVYGQPPRGRPQTRNLVLKSGHRRQKTKDARSLARLCLDGSWAELGSGYLLHAPHCGKKI